MEYPGLPGTTALQRVIYRRVRRYQRDNQNLYIVEEQTTQWPKEKGQTTIDKTYT